MLLGPYLKSRTKSYVSTKPFAIYLQFFCHNCPNAEVTTHSSKVVGWDYDMPSNTILLSPKNNNQAMERVEGALSVCLITEPTYY